MTTPKHLPPEPDAEAGHLDTHSTGSEIIYGFIGLGSMGLPMAGHLADYCAAAGDRLLVWNRTAGRAGELGERGVVEFDDPVALVGKCDVVFVMLPDLPELIALVNAPVGLLSEIRHRLTLVVCSSVSPAGVREFAEDATRRTNGLVSVVDAPVSGGTEGATAATLAIMVGGDTAAVETAWPALTSMGTTVRHLGPVGAGALAKVCNQMVVAATIVALSEASVVAEAAGVSVEGLLEVLAGGLAASQVLAIKSANLVSRTYAATGKARYMAKDLGFAIVEAGRVRADVAQTSLSLDRFIAVDEAGWGDDDVSVVHSLIRERSGLTR